ncbi:MAG TPA: hypothetical protein VEI48_05700 [Candidatus Sulfotelmatobacter sp.]|jgi:hypothetical protein|nr:hypothetical protein [Candidatus Sulfotelmatobacter sp.]
MPDGLDAVLRLVSEGRLSADEAAPLVEAILAVQGGPASLPGAEAPSTAPAGTGMPDHVRVLVTERGRPVVNLRVPLALGKAAVALVPGLSLGDTARLDAALAAGRMGPLLDVTDDDGDGVRVVLE